MKKRPLSQNVLDTIICTILALVILGAFILANGGFEWQNPF